MSSVLSPYPWAPGFYPGDRPQIVTTRFQYEDGHTHRSLPRHRWLRRPEGGAGAKTPTEVSDEVQELDAARPRWRRLSRRHQVGVHTAGRVAAVPRGQRRRIRTRHLQGPPPHGVRSAPAHRGMPDRQLRRRPVAVLPLHPRRDAARARTRRQGARRRVRRRATSARTSSAPTSASTSCCTTAPAPTWSARRPH